MPIGRPPPPRGTACRRRRRTPPRLARRSRASRRRGPRAAPARRRRRVRSRPLGQRRAIPVPAPRRPRPATPPLPRPGRRGRRAAIRPSRGAPSARPSASTRRPRARSRPAGSGRSAFRGWRAAPRALLRGARRHACDLAPDAQPSRRQERVQELPRRDGRLGGGGASGVAGAGRVIPIRRQAREDGMRWGLAPEGWGVLGSATVTLSTRTRQAVPGFPTGPTSQCAPKSCLGRAASTAFPRFPHGSPQGRLSGCETGFERVGEHLRGRHAVVVGGGLGGRVARAGRVADEEHRRRDVRRENAGVVAGV